MEKLIFLDIEEFRKLKESDRKNIILLEYPPEDFSEIKLETIEKFNIEEFFPVNLLERLEKRSEKTLEEFYKIINGKVTYKNIDLFSVIKNRLLRYFDKYVQFIDILDYIIKTNKPKKVLIRYHKREIKRDEFLDNPELSVLILKEICSARNIPIKIEILKEEEKLVNINIKTGMLNLLGTLQNAYFKTIFLNKTKKKKILFIGGKNAYLPILEYLKDKAIVIRGGVNTGQIFFNRYQKYYLTFGNKPKNTNFKFDKSKIYQDISSLKYKGYSFYNIILPNLDYFFNTYSKILMGWIDFTYKIEPHIDAVVTTNDTIALEQIIIEVLKKCKKRSYVIQHGYTTLSEGFFPLVESKMLANKMFVWGNDTKKWMIKEGLKEENLIITGSIKFDEYLKKDKYINIKKEFNIPENKKIIFFIPEPNKDLKIVRCILSNKELTELYRILFDTIEELKEYFLIIKPHPSDKYINLPKTILNKKGISNCIILDKSFSLKPLLQQSDLIITIGSTATLEAMFFKKPIIILNFFNKEQLVPFAERGMCVYINNKKRLRKGIINSIYNKERLVKDYEKDFGDYVLNDGKAYKRISDAILKE